MLITTTDSNGKNVRSDQPKIFTQDFSEYIVFIDDSPQIKQTGLGDRLREKTETMRREWISNITHDLKTPLSPIKGDAEIMLKINAFVHGGKDTEVTIKLSVSECGLNISISDNGKGMSAAETDRLFDRYYRGTNTESKTEGTGLGLAIAKSMIELHGGTISVISSPGKGTAFLICFPTLMEH